MNTPIQELHPEIFHYTTAPGLHGILQSNCIWATHSGYLNDSSECKLFFNDRLPQLLTNCAKKLMKSGSNIHHKDVERLKQILSERTPDYYDAFLTSFCGHDKGSPASKDGLLSQWRGYGSDGGYAISFDTAKLLELLNEELSKFHYGVVSLRAVEYMAPQTLSDFKFCEMTQHEEALKKIFTEYMVSGDINAMGDFLTPMVLMAVTLKHIGFVEENEVRIVMIPVREQHLSNSPEDLRNAKSLVHESFYPREGLMVPHLTLFQNQKLPINRLLVGPHPDKEKRRASVQRLLLKYGYDVEVTVSDIPYVGR